MLIGGRERSIQVIEYAVFIVSTYQFAFEYNYAKKVDLLQLSKLKDVENYTKRENQFFLFLYENLV